MFDNGKLAALSLDELDDLEEKIIDALEELQAVQFENRTDYFLACDILQQMRRKVQLHQDERFEFDPNVARAALPWRPAGQPLVS